MTSRRLAICSWSLRPRDPVALVAFTQQCGVDSVQLALVPVLEDPQWSGVSAILQEEGVEILSGMLAAVGEDYTSLASIA